MNRTPFFAIVVVAMPAALFGAPALCTGDASLAPSPLAVASSPEDSRQDDAIRRAFKDVLNRSPSSSELRRYRDLMEDKGWTERDVREDLRAASGTRLQSERRAEDPDRIVRRAYQDILEREPDSAGLRLYRSRIIDEHWSEQDVREALRKSPEYRDKNTMTQQKAEEVVRRAYRSVLNREPDSGSSSYVNKVLRDHWTEQDVARELRNSAEYRNKHR